MMGLLLLHLAVAADLDPRVVVPERVNGCELGAPLQAALLRLRPGLDVVVGAGRESDLHVEADRLAMRLRSSSRVVLERTLVVEPSACGVVVESMALILDRFFANLRWQGSGPLPLTRLIEEPPEPAEPAEPVAEAPSEPVTVERDDAQHETHLAVAPAAVLVVEESVGFGGGGDVRFRLSQLELAVECTVRVPEHQAIELGAEQRGELTIDSVRASLRAGWCFTAQVDICVAAQVGWEHLRAHVSGPGVIDTGGRSVQLWGAGPVVRLDWPVQESLRPFVELSSLFRFVRSGFAVSGATSDHVPPVASIGLRVGFEWSFF